MKKYIFCYLLLGGFWIGGASVEGMELSTNEGTNLKKLVLISPQQIPDYSFEGKERIGFIPESKIKKILDLGGIPSLKDLCLDFLASEIESWKNTPPEGKKERGLGQVGIVSEEEDSQPGEEKAASSPSFLQRVDDQIEALSKNCPLNEDLKLLLKVRICQKRGGIWEEWKNLSEEERNAHGDISFWREIGKEDFLDFYNLEDEKNGYVSCLRHGSTNFNKNENENENENEKKVLVETARFYSMVRKIKIHRLMNTDIRSIPLWKLSVKRVKSFLKGAENLESVCFVGNDLFELIPFSHWVSHWEEGCLGGPIFEEYIHAMKENPSLNLKELILEAVFREDDNNRESAINKVCKTLQKDRFFQSLEILNLRGNYLKDTQIKELVVLLKDKKFLPCLRSLILGGDRIGSETRKELWEALKERPCFQVLDLTKNSLFYSFLRAPLFDEITYRKLNLALEQNSDQRLSDSSSLRGLQSGSTVEDLWLQEWAYLPLYTATDRKPLGKLTLGNFRNL